MCYSSESIAKRIAKSLEPDNYAFVISKVRGKSIVSVIVSESIPSLIHTVDDYLSCVGVAEKTLEIGEHPHKRKVSVTS